MGAETTPSASLDYQALKKETAKVTITNYNIFKTVQGRSCLFENVRAQSILLTASSASLAVKSAGLKGFGGKVPVRQFKIAPPSTCPTRLQRQPQKHPATLKNHLGARSRLPLIEPRSSPFPLHSLGSATIPLNTNMAKALSKSQIVTSLAETVGITKKQAVQILEALVSLAYKNAKNSFTIPGLGKIVLVNRKARMGRNPATGETIKIAAKRVVKFRIAKAAKDAILGSK